MRHKHLGSCWAQRPRQLVLLLAVVASGCRNSADSRPKLRQPDELAPRTTGCIDTPFVGPDHRSSTAGVQCGREASPTVVTLRGRVVAEASGGLPGAGLEHLRVHVHAIDGALRLDRLPPALVESTTGPQGAFAVSLEHVGECLIVVRPESGGPVLAARRIECVSTSDLVLLVSQEDRAREQPALTPTD
ncbi:MAG TPA: hypothetical protein VM869_19650 [Enhygromyxa sp.]|nr:hypothetical protein [Enhygromyxa sp.]